MARTKNYINNKTLYASMIQHRNLLENAVKNNKPKPQLSNYIGQSILLICNNLAKKPNFSGYSYKEDMINDGIMDCIAAVDNFNPEKTNTPFAYFTQIVYFAFLRRIQKEKKQLYVKYKATEQIGILDEFEMMEFEDGTSKQFELYDNIAEFIENYEEAKENKKAVKKPKGIEKFLDE